MANPAWFFSTLAQATAAIIGFIIAFSAVLYQLERQKRDQRTDELRETLIDLRDKYYPVLGTMAGNLGFVSRTVEPPSDAAVPEPPEDVVLASNSKLEKHAKNDFDFENPALGLYSLHIARVFFVRRGG